MILFPNTLIGSKSDNLGGEITLDTNLLLLLLSSSSSPPPLETIPGDLSIINDEET